MLAAKPHESSSVPQIYMVETKSCKLALWLVTFKGRKKEFNLHLGVVKDNVRNKVIRSLHSKESSLNHVTEKSWQGSASEEPAKASLLH